MDTEGFGVWASWKGGSGQDKTSEARTSSQNSKINFPQPWPEGGGGRGNNVLKNLL